MHTLRLENNTYPGSALPSIQGPVPASRAMHHIVESSQASFRDGERAWTLLMPYLWEKAVIKKSVVVA
jgi:hypothetical protein